MWRRLLRGLLGLSIASMLALGMVSPPAHASIAPGTPRAGEKPSQVPGMQPIAKPVKKPAKSKPAPKRATDPANGVKVGPRGQPEKAMLLPASAAALGISNLGCVVFEGKAGPDARSALVNRCGSQVRLNYCLQYQNGADNCFPMAIGGDATLWELSAGQSLVMPGTDVLRRWAVFACQAPLKPWKAKFQGGQLLGTCVETGFEPVTGTTPTRVVRSNDPSTWPPGTTNMACLEVDPALSYNQWMQLTTHCPNPINVVVCADTISTGFWRCSGAVSAFPSQLGIVQRSMLLPAPNQMTRWAAFACEEPLEPANVSYAGGGLIGDCILPPHKTAVALPRRAQSSALSRLSGDSSAEERAARERQRAANSERIDSERARLDAEAGALWSGIAEVAAIGAQTYLQVEQQKSQIAAATALARQQQAAQSASQIQRPMASTAQFGSAGPQSAPAAVPAPARRHEVAAPERDGTSCIAISEGWENMYKMRYFQNRCSVRVVFAYCTKNCARFHGTNTLSPGERTSFIIGGTKGSFYNGETGPQMWGACQAPGSYPLYKNAQDRPAISCLKWSDE